MLRWVYVDIDNKWKKYLNIWKFNLRLLQGFAPPASKLWNLSTICRLCKWVVCQNQTPPQYWFPWKTRKKIHFITIVIYTLLRHIGIQQKNNFQKRWSYGRELHQKPKMKFSIFLLWVVTHLKLHLQILPYWKISNFLLEAYFLDRIFLLDT